MAAADDKGKPRLPVAPSATGAAGREGGVAGEEPAIRACINWARTAAKAASFSRGIP